MQGGCKHSHRWNPPDDAGQAGAQRRSDDDLLVDHPVDLAWIGLACKVCIAVSVVMTTLGLQLLLPVAVSLVLSTCG